MKQADERAAWEAALVVLRESVAQLREQRAECDRQIQEKEQHIRYFEAQLGATNRNGATGKRLRRGEPRRRLLEFFREHGDERGHPVVELSEKSGLGWSTVRAALSNGKDKDFEEVQEGLWRLKEVTVAQ